MVKKAYFFSLDAFIAVMVVIAVIALVPSFYLANKSSDQTVYFSSDLIDILAAKKLGSINNSELQAVINSSNKNILNRTVLEQALRYRITGNDYKAEEMIRIVASGLLPEDYGFGVWAEGYDEAIYSEGPAVRDELLSSKQMISGIERSRAIEGISSRVFLTGINQRISSSYSYFGGYEGDGNLTKKLYIPLSVNNISSASMELDVNSDFELYINGNYSGLYSPQFINLTADSWELSAENLSLFKGGNNTLGIRFRGPQKYIGGGYFKVTYTTEELDIIEEESYEFPGIDGIINLYSSFYIPGTLDAMEIYLHYYSDYEIFLNIGDKTVFDYDIKGENRVTISNEELNLSLNYSDLGLKTIPLRLGLRNVSYYQIGFGGTADSILVTDVSGSMDECGEYESTQMCDYDCCVGGECPDSYSCESDTCIDEECGACQFYNLCEYECCRRICIFGCFWVCDSGHSCESDTCSDEECGSCSGFYNTPRNHNQYNGQSSAQNHNSWYDTSCLRSKLEVAKEADKEFVDVVLAMPENRVGLVSYEYSTDTHGLSTDKPSLYSEIDSYVADGGTCICCGINEAVDILDAQSNSSRTKSMLVMSDGQATQGCSRQPNSTSSDDAVQAACDAYEDHNITVYTVGFGSDVDTATLDRISKCGRGEYYYSNVSNLTTIYQGVAERIVNMSYEAQTITEFEETKVNSTLYPDSYILLNYTPEESPEQYGRIPLTVETPRLANSITKGSFDIPEDVEVYDAKILSYSADRWTDRASITTRENSAAFYNLSYFGNDYHVLGDPYIVNIPISRISQGENNITISTGLSPSNATGGSPDNKIIYSVGVNVFMNYTGVFESSQGCIWNISFEDHTYSLLKVPPSYNGTGICEFTSSTECRTDYSTDAMKNAACQLFDQLDFDGDGLLYVKIGQDELETESYSIGGIPYMWGPTMMDVRVWR